MSWVSSTKLAYVINKIKSLLDGKVNSESGKGLSTNDFTNTLKNKLDGIDDNATKDTVMKGASSANDGAQGLVPKPSAGQERFFFRGNGTWSAFSNSEFGFAYGICETDASTINKTVPISSLYYYKNHSFIVIKFINDVPANSTLNIKEQGIRYIYYRGAKITSDVINGGDTCLFAYYDSKFNLIASDAWIK